MPTTQFDAETVRKMLAPLWGTVFVVTAAHGGKNNGQIALSAFPASIVADRPRVLVEIWQSNLTHDLIRDGRAFAIHFLRADQWPLIPRFGYVSGRDSDKFDGIAFDVGETGVPILRDCLGYVECRLRGTLDAGDMTCFLGDAVAGERRNEGEPLTWRQAQQTMPKEIVDQYTPIRKRNEAWAAAHMPGSA